MLKPYEICLSEVCKTCVCNNAKECSVLADEDSLGWKAGVSVVFCISCYDMLTLNETKQARI